jgi:hypothetical protein
MKIGFEYIFVIIAFVAIIMLSSYGSSVVVPYQKDDLFSKQFKYEGMETAEESKTNSNIPMMGNSVSSSNSISPTMGNSPMTQQNKEKMLSGFLTNENKVNGNVDMSKESFEGMFALSPYELNSSVPTLDRLSNLKGGANCDSSRAAGYSNSKGPLCIDDTTMQLLRTRGGNQTGAPSQIGQ